MVVYNEEVKHKHHIVPKHMGGKDDPDNLVEVSIKEHANLHKQLWEDLGNWQDYIAWQGLTRNIDSQQINRLKQSLGGREGGLKTKGVPKTENHRRSLSEAKKGKTSNMSGKKHSEETLAKMRKSRTTEHRSNISKGMKGIQRTEEQKERYRLAALKRWENRRTATST